MNNKTRIRLHLSKNLFESIAKEVLTEAKKANDGYTVTVKQPKMPKQSKSQAASPEVQKTDAEATMGEATPNIPMPSNKPKMPPVPGQKPAGADNAKSTDLAKKAMDFDVIIPTLAKQGIIDDNEKKTLQTLLDKVTQAVANSIKEIETKVAEEGQLNEIDPSSIDWSAVAAGLGAIGLAPLAIDKIHDMWKKKFPKSFEKAQGLNKAIDKQASGN